MQHTLKRCWPPLGQSLGAARGRWNRQRGCRASLALPTRPRSAASLVKMQTFLPLACFVPMLNYAGVLVVHQTLPLTFQIYLCAGMATWSLAAIRGGWLLGEERVVSSLMRDPPYMRY